PSVSAIRESDFVKLPPEHVAIERIGTSCVCVQERKCAWRSRSIGCVFDQAWADEALDPARVRMQPGPVVERKIDDDETGRRQLFVDTLACLPVPRSDQAYGKVV